MDRVELTEWVVSFLIALPTWFVLWWMINFVSFAYNGRCTTDWVRFNQWAAEQFASCTVK